VSPKRLPVVSGARVVRALEKDGFDVIGTKEATASYAGVRGL
jgi:predicted RNA binding protein YcfA (HicA-like mRNA interferase family)